MLRFLYNRKLIVLSLLSLMLIMGFQCTKYSYSSCINNKISKFKSECCSNGANVREYWFQSQSVFVFNPGNCGADLPSYVLSADCDTLGFLGGIIGNQMINGESFTLAEEKGLIWSN